MDGQTDGHMDRQIKMGWGGGMDGRVMQNLVKKTTVQNTYNPSLMPNDPLQSGQVFQHRLLVELSCDWWRNRAESSLL